MYFTLSTLFPCLLFYLEAGACDPVSTFFKCINHNHILHTHSFMI